MSVAVRSRARSAVAAVALHPNELDLRRIERALTGRSRYRYVQPSVEASGNGYLVRSPCCSRSVDSAGSPIDIARIEWLADERGWLLMRKDHKAGCWIEDSRFARLAELFIRLNTDPQKLFWQ